MSFIEITVYAAACDGCGGQADYDQFCGYSDSEIFLCDSCWRAPCPGCEHARQLHITTDHCFHQGCRCHGFPADTRIEAAS
uniref:hypothetical protein n=1 Tax=Nocardia suismassiliense TaxID=2077092 RepID=UPI003F497FE7